MTPEARNYLDKAHNDLEDARKIFEIGLWKVAARAAYYAAFHAAEALIVERSGRIAKTHSGVRVELARLAKAATERPLATFLAQSYKYKEISDYGIGDAATVTESEASLALKDAEHFVDRIAEMLTADRQT